ncbi:hypothetical protein [Prosthecobacter sp.]|uniref:hypothetical protein n=1 Tax=Prosthecobacter sp. TaxID=1965333 RepID=UPI002AB81044|nr:hypothetical protein [Prosthecobacter sp.]MDZ4401698.1 hypothetical protein [Prosthecobacter sp.]
MKTYWLLILGWIQITLLVGAEPAAKTNYEKMVDMLFDESKTCLVKGQFVWKGDIHEANFKTEDKRQLSRLKDVFSHEKPEFAGLIDPDNKPVSMYSAYFDFTWLNKDRKELGHAVIIDGDTLIFNDKHIYKTKDLTFLLSTAGIVSPKVFDKKRKE